MSPAPFDGNVTAGDLADVFAFDATTAMTTCATCRHTHPIATLHAYLRAPGMVLRCASCDAVQTPPRARPPPNVARPARHRHAHDSGSGHHRLDARRGGAPDMRLSPSWSVSVPWQRSGIEAEFLTSEVVVGPS